MQTKSSHRALKWTLFMGIAASLASACVVSTGDGDDVDVDINGGESGSSNTSGTKNTGGTKAGSSSGGASAGTSTTAGTTSGGGEDGGGGESYVPGACQDSLSTPSMLPSCDAKDDDNDCGLCLKSKCCDTLQECYGTEPTSACGYGPTAAEDDLGQFDCIRDCYQKNADGIKTQAEVITECAGECANQCADVGDGLINEDTQALLDCAQNGEDGDMDMGTDDCNDACFPAPM